MSKPEREVISDDATTEAVMEGIAGLIMGNDAVKAGIDTLKAMHNTAVLQLATGKEFYLVISPVIVNGILDGFKVEQKGPENYQPEFSIEQLWEGVRMTVLKIIVDRNKPKVPSNIFQILTSAMGGECNCEACSAERAAGRQPTTKH